MDLKSDRNLVKRVDEYGKGLSDWEVEFVESCMKWLDEGKTLTDKQRKVMNDLDERKVN